MSIAWLLQISSLANLCTWRLPPIANERAGRLLCFELPAAGDFGTDRPLMPHDCRSNVPFVCKADEPYVKAK